MPRFLMLNNPPIPQKTYIIFPPAGGMASFKQGWLPYFPLKSRVICIEYPGRGIALNDEFPSSFQNFSHSLLKIISACRLEETCFIGESMGGYLAFEVAKALYLRLNRCLSKLLLISVAAADGIKKDIQFFITLPNEEFESEVIKRMFEGANPWSSFDLETKSHFMNLLRQDMRLLSTYHQGLSIQLPISLMVTNGLHDSYCHTKETKAYWENSVSKDFSYDTFIGSHSLTPQNTKNILDKFIKFTEQN